ncbi:interleukin-17 receptor D-like [Aplochiton taeniatus]
MWIIALFLCQLLNLCQVQWAQQKGFITPRDCSLECIQQAGPGCEYCRINTADVEKALGIQTLTDLGSCVPWPCAHLLGDQKNSDLCQHYVHAPHNVTVEFVTSQNANVDTIVVSWKPSEYGIAFLRGFQVSLQALGASQVACQLFLFQRNLSLPASYAQKVYRSDPFPGLVLSAQYAVTVMALPVPEQWDKFYKSKFFFTRSCAEKNGIDRCKRDWYPKNVEVHQERLGMVVTFNLAPPNLGIGSYFSLCFKKGLKRHPDIVRIHPIAADEVDAVRTTFYVQVVQLHNDFIEECKENAIQEEVTSLTGSRLTPPRLLICYSSRDGPAHVRAVMQLGAFLQQHMATKVYLDLWDSLSMAEEGVMGWYCRRIKESDFVLVVCSQGLNPRESSDQDRHDEEEEEEEEGWESTGNNSAAAVALIGEELGRAKARGRDLSKYMAAIFEYSEERDVPLELGLLSCYKLPRDLPLLFSRLHGVALHRPGSRLEIEHISEEGFTKLPAGAALQWAIRNAGSKQKDKPKRCDGGGKGSGS